MEAAEMHASFFVEKTGKIIYANTTLQFLYGRKTLLLSG